MYWLNQNKKQNSNSPISFREIERVVKDFPLPEVIRYLSEMNSTKTLETNSFQNKFHKTGNE